MKFELYNFSTDKHDLVSLSKFLHYHLKKCWFQVRWFCKNGTFSLVDTTKPRDTRRNETSMWLRTPYCRKTVVNVEHPLAKELGFKLPS